MIPFTYERATDVPAAVDFLRDHDGAKLIAGGTNLVDHMKLGVADPPASRVAVDPAPPEAEAPGFDGALDGKPVVAGAAGVDGVEAGAW